METETQTTEEELDANFQLPEGFDGVALDDNEFDIDLGGIDTRIPLLEKNPKMKLLIRKAEVKANKKKTGKNLVVFFTNAEAETTDIGVTVPPGEALITKYFSLGPNAERLGEEGYDPNRWKKDLAQWIDALHGSDQSNRARFTPELVVDMKDRVVLAKVEIEEPQEGTGFDKKNIVSGFRFVNN